MIAKKSLITVTVVVASLIAGVVVSCKVRNTASRQKSGAQGTAAAGVSPFAWELADLPACYSSNADAEVFVWRAQKTLKCNKGNGQWQ